MGYKQFRIIVDRESSAKFLDAIAKVRVYPNDDVIKLAAYLDPRYAIYYAYDHNCNIEYLEPFNDYSYIIELFDNNLDRRILIDIVLH